MCFSPAAAAVKSLQSCPTLCNPINSSSPGSTVPGILQASILVHCHFLLQYMKVKSESEVAQSCPTLSDPMDCSLLGSSIHGIFQARVPEWGAIAFSGLPSMGSQRVGHYWVTELNWNDYDLKENYSVHFYIFFCNIV